MATKTLFSKAQAQAASPVAPKVVSKKKEVVEVVLDGLKELAEIDVLIKRLTMIKASFEEQVKSDSMKYFIKDAVSKGEQPDNFRGVDEEETVTSSVELRKRATTSALTDSEIELLTSLGIQTEKKVTVQEMYGINPVYATDRVLMKKVSKALSPFVPEDFIVKQEERSTTIVTAETIDDVFQNKRQIIKQVLPIVSVITVRPKLVEDADINVIFSDVKKIVTKFNKEN